MARLSLEGWVNLALVLALLAAPLIAVAIDRPFYVTLATRIAIFALAAVGLNLALGLGGLVSFGHAAFFGIGGYVAGILAHHHFMNMPLIGSWTGSNQMLTIWAVAIACSGLAALVIGALSLRTAGVYFIMITLAFAQMIFYFALSWPAYGGEDGLPILVRNQFPGLNTMVTLELFFIVFALLILALVLFATLRDSRFGAALMAARQNPGRVAALGMSPFGVRLVAFVISGMITGLAGALMADLNRFVSPSMIAWQMSGELILILIIGGVGRLCGPIAGAAVFILFEFLFGGLTEHWQFFLGLVLLGVVLFARGGIIGLIAGRARHG